MNNQSKIKFALDELLKREAFDNIGEVFSKDYIAYTDGKEFKGHSIVKRWAKELRTTFSNLKVSQLIFLSETEDIVVWQRTLKGKHTKSIKGIPASEKVIQWNELIVSKFKAGKIESEWVVSELVGKLLLKSRIG